MRNKVMIAGCVIILCVSAWVYKGRDYLLDPATYENKFKIASQFLIDGNNDEAILGFQELIKANDQFPAVFFNLGRAYNNKKEWDTAIAAYDRALQFNIDFKHLIHFHKGLAAFNKEDFDLAQESFKTACSLKPDYAESYYYLGMNAQKQLKFDDAVQYLTQASKINTSLLTSLLSLAHDLRNQEKLESAYECCKNAIAIDPKGAHAYYAYLMMGDIDNMQSRPEQAIEHYQKACDANAQCHEAFNNLGALYAGQYGDLKKAQPYLEAALKIKPDHAGTRAGLSALYLVLGDYDRGWAEYEHRLEHFFERAPRTFEKPRWDGKSSLEGKTIIVHAEQGLGDTLQFIRYAQNIKNKGAKKVIVEVQKPLRKILSRCPYIDALIIPDEQWPEHDVQVPLMSLPYLCKTKVNSIPAAIPYITPDQSLLTEWKEKLSPDKKYKIGICWHVEPSHDADVFRGEGKTISVSGCKRSVPLELFLPLAKLNNVSVYSLQKHNGLEEFAKVNHEGLIKDFGPDFDAAHGSFMDTAAIMKNLDLVITADTSVAHLAGALGVPVWIMLPFPADWRWLLDRKDTPWYPSMRLFRKSRNDKDWSRVMDEVKIALKQ